MNEQLKKFNRGDIVLGKVIEIEASRALIKIYDCEPVYIIKEVISTQKIVSIKEVLQLGKIYEFAIAIDYSCRFYKTDTYYLSIVELEYSRNNQRLKQLAEENVNVYTKIIKSYIHGVLVNIENDNFLISNIHLKTKIPNKELVGQIIPVRIVNYKTDTYNRFYASHLLALDTSIQNEYLDNSKIEKKDFIEQEVDKHQLYSLDDIVVGKVVEIFSDYALVDVGTDKYAYIPLEEMSRWAKSSEEVLYLGLVREFIISDIFYNLGHSSLLGLSIKKLDEQIGDKRIKQVCQEDENIIFYS